jgi:DNA-directed RNA polymerase sigma subunit (sigma70/sigma32)
VTLEKIGEKLGITTLRVRPLNVRAIEKLCSWVDRNREDV